MEQLLLDLQETAVAVLEEIPLLVSYSGVYKSVETLCVYKHIEQSRLADFLFQSIDRQLSTWEIPCLQQKADGSDSGDCLTDILLFVENFQSWLNRLELLEQLFLFIDRSYLLPHPKKKTILEYGLNKFADRFLYRSSGDTLILENFELLVKKIHYEWRSSFDQEFLNSGRPNEFEIRYQLLISAIIRLDYHHSFLSNSGFTAILVGNYKQLKGLWLEQGGEYLKIVLDSLSSESKTLITSRVPQNYVEYVLRTLKWDLIFSNFEEVLEMSLPILLQRELLDYLKGTWKLCEVAMSEAGFDACRSFTYIWGRLIQKLTAEVVERSKIDPPTLIPSLFAFWERAGKIVEACFDVESVMFETRSAQGKALGSKGLGSFVHIQLARYCDLFFKLARKSKEENLYDRFENEVLTIFKLLPSKSDFMALYERDLSKRMLFGKSFNFDMELRLVDLLLAVVGESDESSNVLAMFRDMENSKEIHSLVQLKCMPNVEFNALVLEKKYWPEVPNPIPNIALPESLSGALDEFTSRYQAQSEKHNFQKLDWSNYLLHLITVSVPFTSGSRELIISVLQASILMHFDEADRISIAELLKKTKMDKRQLKKILASLSTEKYPILIVGEEEVEFNFQAELKGYRIKIPMLREKEVEVADEATKVIQKSINPSVRAFVVRCMKQEKQMMYPELLSRVLEAKQGVLVVAVKENIEYLIANDYLKREPDGVTMTYIP